jgi:hypothetical protein
MSAPQFPKYMYFKRKYPALSNILGCHFAAEIASEFDYKYLRRDSFPKRINDLSHPAYQNFRKDVNLLFLSREAKEILEEERWFVADFEDEHSAQDFIIREIWNIYFPNEGYCPPSS